MKIKILILFVSICVIALYFIPAPQPSFESIYTKEDEISESLKKFENLPTKAIEFNDKKWNYLVGGEGEKTIFFAHGMGGSYYMWWQQFYALEKDFKIITFELPKGVSTLEEASQGILAILDKEKIDKFSIVGSSMGGFIAQYVVNKTPERIEKAVFSNTFSPGNDIKKRNSWRSFLVPYLPEVVIYYLRNHNFKKGMAATSSSPKLIEAYLCSVPFNKKRFMERFKIVTDEFDVEINKSAVDAIPILIFECDNDPLVSAGLRKKIKETYPNSEVYSFGNEGHIPSVSKADEYNKVLRAFLEKDGEEIVSSEIENQD